MTDLACFGFTKKEIDALALPAEGHRDYYRDVKVRGLQLVVYPSGRKVFVLYRKIKRRPERILIGPYPDLSIEQARQKAEELNGSIAKGENPAQTKRTLKAEATLEDAFDSFLELQKKPKCKSWEDDEDQLRRYLDWDTSPRWKARKLSEIRRVDIERLHVKVGEQNGPYAANRLLALLSAIFNYSMKHGWDGPNPANGIDKFAEQQRERFLQPDEMPKFFKALKSKATPRIFSDYFTILLLVAARRMNVLSMRWEELNLEDAIWRIPDTKGGDPLEVPLVPEAVRILKSRQKLVGDSPWVFPSNARGRKSSTGHLMEPKAAWKDLLDRAGIKDLRLHDLRRTNGSWQVNEGASLAIIGRSLGHKQQSTTQIYARLHLDPVRESMNKAAAAMLAAAKKAKQSGARQRG